MTRAVIFGLCAIALVILVFLGALLAKGNADALSKGITDGASKLTDPTGQNKVAK